MKKFGHRGACGHAPENTLASMRKALALGVDGFEFDIRLSKDGEPIVIHDATLERTTNGKGNVADFTFKELQQFDAGHGEKIPHLNEVFSLVAKRCELFIELKVDAVAEVERTIRHWVDKGWDYASIWVLSFDHRQLVEMHRINPKVQTCALIEGIPTTLAAFGSEAGANAIAPYVGVIDADIIADARIRGMKIFTWTANDPAIIARAQTLGVDGIMSDFPERL